MIDNKDIENLKEAFKEVFETKDEAVEFKNEILTGQDEILKKLDILLSDKDISDAQDKRKTKVLEIHNNALKREKILSEQESLQVDQLSAF